MPTSEQAQVREDQRIEHGVISVWLSDPPGFVQWFSNRVVYSGAIQLPPKLRDRRYCILPVLETMGWERGPQVLVNAPGPRFRPTYTLLKETLRTWCERKKLQLVDVEPRFVKQICDGPWTDSNALLYYARPYLSTSRDQQTLSHPVEAKALLLRPASVAAGSSVPFRPLETVQDRRRTGTLANSTAAKEFARRSLLYGSGGSGDQHKG